MKPTRALPILCILLLAPLPARAAASFTESFSAGLGSNLSAVYDPAPSNVNTAGANVLFTGTNDAGRAYVGTNDTDYISAAWTATIQLTVTNALTGSGTSAWFGMGKGTATDADAFGTPTDGPVAAFEVAARSSPFHLEKLLDGTSTQGGLGNGGAPTVGVTNLTDFINTNSTVTIRLEHNGHGAITVLTNGVTRGTINAADNGFNATNSRLFFGGGNGTATFDNLAVTTHERTFKDEFTGGPAANWSASQGGPNASSVISFAGDKATFTGSGDANRTYLRTVRTDYSAVSFVAEVTATNTNTGGAGSVFFGMGPGSGVFNGSSLFGEPSDTPSIYFRVGPDNFNFTDVSDNGTVLGTADDVGTGTHRLRFTWNAFSMQALLEIDADWTGGPFVADLQFAVDGADNGFDLTNSRLFLGGANGVMFDNFNVSFAPAPTALPAGLALMGLGVRRGGRRRRRI